LSSINLCYSQKKDRNKDFVHFLEIRIISTHMVILNRFCTLVCYLNLAASELTWFVGPHGRQGMEFCTPSKLQGSITLLEIKRIIFVGVNHRQWDFLPIGGHELLKRIFCNFFSSYARWVNILFILSNLSQAHLTTVHYVPFKNAKFTCGWKMCLFCVIFCLFVGLVIDCLKNTMFDSILMTCFASSSKCDVMQVYSLTVVNCLEPDAVTWTEMTV